VTAIRELARRAGRYAVEVGGAAITPVAIETIAECKLAVGLMLDAAALERLRTASAVTACYDKALDALARRARSSKDLERWLLEREHPRAAIAATIERLSALGLLDDERFAEAYVNGPARTKGFGQRRVAAELRRRGVPSAIVDRAIAGRADADGSESDALAAAAARRARTLRTQAPDVAQRRLVGWLVRRGFAIGAAIRAAKDALASVR